MFPVNAFIIIILSVNELRKIDDSKMTKYLKKDII
jgi:hypothetical protein